MRFRLLTYNIHRAIGVDRRFRPERIIRILMWKRRGCQHTAIVLEGHAAGDSRSSTCTWDSY